MGHDVVADPSGAQPDRLTGQFATIDGSLTGMENVVLQARLLGLTRQQRGPGGRATERSA